MVILTVASFGVLTPSAAEAEESAEPGAAAISVPAEETILAPTEAAESVPAEEATAAPLASMLFRPDWNITRAAAARMLYQIAGSPHPGAGCGGLTDVPAWAHDGICWLVNNGYATGYPNKTFGPDKTIIRGDAANMLHRIAGYPDPGTGAGCASLTDVPVWADDAICWPVNNGHASGFPDSTFKPLARISRGQAANMLHRIAGRPAPGSGCGSMIDVPAWAHDGICWLVNKGYATGFPVPPPPPPPPSYQVTVASRVNSSRTVRGLGALTVSATLNAKAQQWSAYLAQIGRLAHSNLASGVPSNWRALAENVGYGSSLESVHLSFMGSSGHRANILGNYTHLGTGVTKSGSRYYVVHVFMRV